MYSHMMLNTATGPANAVEAALYFFQALRAYPSPSELAAIYQKTLPENILAVSGCLLSCMFTLAHPVLRLLWSFMLLMRAS